MLTILGEHIDLIRPRLIPRPRKEKEGWAPERNMVAKTRKIGAAEFFKFCLFYDYTKVERRRTYDSI